MERTRSNVPSATCTQSDPKALYTHDLARLAKDLLLADRAELTQDGRPLGRLHAGATLLELISVALGQLVLLLVSISDRCGAHRLNIRLVRARRCTLVRTPHVSMLTMRPA